MIRTQVQINEDQIKWLKDKARETGVSVSHLIRKSVDLYRSQEDRLPMDRKEKAIAAMGRFASGQSDVASRHDHYLVQAYSGDET